MQRDRLKDETDVLQCFFIFDAHIFAQSNQICLIKFQLIPIGN